MATKKCNKKCAPQECSQLQQHRGKFKPVLPNILKNGPASVKVKAAPYLRYAGNSFRQGRQFGRIKETH